MSGNADDPRRSWRREVDGLLRVLLTARNQSMTDAQHEVTELRSALRRIERRLDVHGGRSTGDDVAVAGDSRTSDEQRAGLMREPMSQQQQVNWPGCLSVLKPNFITLAGSELASNTFGASSELVRSWLRTS